MLIFFVILISGIRGEPMLVLGRKPGEYVLIDNNIMVKVIKSDEGHLRLAIEAPKHISIVRGELWEENNMWRVTERKQLVEASAT